MSWQEIHYEYPVSEKSKLSSVESYLHGQGAQSVSILFENNRSEVVGLFEAPSIELRTKLERAMPQARRVFWTTHENQDWSESWKAFYKPQALGESFFIVPLWERGKVHVPHGKTPIFLEPGQAFGTGLHPTTQVCAEFLEKARSEGVNQDVLDVGTGSGILALVAKKLGFEKVDAFDCDEICETVARENFENNQVTGISVWTGELSEVEKNYPVVVSNILLEVHLSLLEDYLRVCTGILILSGLLVGQEKELIEALEKDFDIEIRPHSNEWVGMFCKRKKPH